MDTPLSPAAVRSLNWRFGLCVALSLGLFLGFFFSVS